MYRGGCLNTRPARIYRGGCLNTRSARIHRRGRLNNEVLLNTKNGPWGLFKHACGNHIEASCSKVLKTERFRYISAMVSDGCQFPEIAGDREAFRRDNKWTVGGAKTRVLPQYTGVGCLNTRSASIHRGGCLNTRPARIHRGGCLNTRSARINRGGCLNIVTRQNSDTFRP